MMMVLSLTVFVDLITAVAAGVVVAAIAYVKQVSDAQLALAAGETDSQSQGPSDREIALLNECGDHLTYFDFGGPLSFGAAADLGHHVRERLSPQHHVALALDFGRVPFMDVSALRAIETIAQDAAHAGKHLFVCGINDAVAQSLDGMGVSDYLPAETRFDTRFEALSAAKEWIFENIPTDDIGRRDDQSKKPVTA
jgi:SulP family sulfate permease